MPCVCCRPSVHHPPTDNTDYEGHLQSLLYTIFSLLGMYVDVEVQCPKGRVDMVMRTPTTPLCRGIEVKRITDVAVINLRNYPEHFALCGLPIVKVGINFDSERHTLGDWVIDSNLSK